MELIKGIESVKVKCFLRETCEPKISNFYEIHSAPVSRTKYIPRYPDSSDNGCPVNGNGVHKIINLDNRESG